MCHIYFAGVGRGGIDIFDCQTKKRLVTLEPDIGGCLYKSVCFSPDGHMIAILKTTDRSIAVWNIRNTSACSEMYELRFDQSIGSFCFTRTSAELLVSTDGHLRLHNALDGNVLQVMEQQCQSVFVGQLGGDMLTVGRDAVVRI
jgi:WD40 repeat protein